MNWRKELDFYGRDWRGVDGFMGAVYQAVKQRGEAGIRAIAHWATAGQVAAVLEPMAAEAAEKLADLEGRHGGLAAELGAKKAAIDLLYAHLRDTDRPRSPENMQRQRDRNRLILEGRELSAAMVELDKLIPDARTRSAGMNRALAELRAIPLPGPDAIPGLAEWLDQD